MFSEEGNLNPATPKKIIWGIVTAGLAAVLLIAGGLDALQTGSIVAAFPFAFVMIFAMYSLLKALKGDETYIVKYEKDIKGKA
jgi:glycine betaine transporter